MATTSKKSLRAFIRVDGSGRDVAGSLQLLRKKPKVGKWREIQAYQCCDPFSYSTTTTSTSSTTSTTTTAPSDINLKSFITLTGRKIGGLNEYTWKWNKKAISLGLSNFPEIGVIAQEAAVLYPNAVTRSEKGYLQVDYSKLV